METALIAVAIGASVALVLAMCAVLDPETERQQRPARAQELAMYRHLPEANLLRLND